ncbi:Histone-lysine N-methyltransferase SETMAR [Ooceraea biroi]|uniref:Histone-lysine N-methyltransferase SETMAR n=1 Tax=Ooceraea biroi TaxID=2015173 RepID=A0A026X2E3_OOCBI|nr:Histone-lysine N-methyltransferase SETMAR [Ooceraea biroi]
MMPQPPYSPDMAPCDFFLFPKIKNTMKGRRFANIEEIKTTENCFQKCFKDWKKRWHKCIISNGDYFEGDKINIDE